MKILPTLAACSFGRIGRALIFASLTFAWAPAFAEKQPAPGLGPEMRFIIVRAASPRCDPVCPEWISAEGSFVPGTPAKFEWFLKKLGDRKLPIVIHSPGGEVGAAMAVAKAIRAHKLDVAVGRTVFTTCSPEQKDCQAEEQGGYAGTAVSISAMCFSACAMAIAGGANRLAGHNAALGVHQVTSYVEEFKTQYRLRKKLVNGKVKTVKEVVRRKRTGVIKAVDATKGMRKKLTRFYEQMGVSRDILPLLEQTPRDQIRVLFQQELLAMKVVTQSGGVEMWTAPEICERPELPSNCRRVASPSIVRIVTSRHSDCEANCGKWISLEGDIDETTLTKLQGALGKAPEIDRVVLSSRGGDLESAIALGRFVRSRGLTVVVGRTIAARCRPKLSVCAGWSADDLSVGSIETEARMPYCGNVCVVALAGGAKRIVGARTPVDFDSLESLQRSWPGKENKTDPDTAVLLSTYLEEMGIDPKLLEQLPKSSRSVRLSGRDLQKMGLTAME